MFIANVEQVYVRDALFKEDGSLRMSDFELICYAHGEYFALRDRPIGFFGYSVAKEEIIRRRLVEPYQKKREGKGKPEAAKKRYRDGGKKRSPRA